jgi:hypothetical protein
MRPITRQSCEYYQPVRLAGYRVLAFWVIGAAVITLGVIGLAGALVIRPLNVSKISVNNIGQDPTGQDLELINSLEDHGYYQGLLGELRRASTKPSK